MFSSTSHLGPEVVTSIRFHRVYYTHDKLRIPISYGMDDHKPLYNHYSHSHFSYITYPILPKYFPILLLVLYHMPSSHQT